jgi:phosphate transport system protein
MNHLNYEIEYLKESFIELLELGRSQLLRAANCLSGSDLELAEEIMRTEKRVNSLELSIEKTCENIIALFQPVATDLRFVLAIFKSVSDIERIGDHADFIASMIKDRQEDPIPPEVLDAYQVQNLFTQVDAIYCDLISSFESTNTTLARKAFKKDKEINKLYRSLLVNMKKSKGEGVDSINNLVDIYAIIARLERSSNLLTNIAEEIIFYIDAEILKHKKKKKKPVEKEQGAGE